MGKKHKKESSDNRFEDFDLVDVTYDRKARRRDRRKEKLKYDKAFKNRSIDDIDELEYEEFLRMQS